MLYINYLFTNLKKCVSLKLQNFNNLYISLYLNKIIKSLVFILFILLFYIIIFKFNIKTNDITYNFNINHNILHFHINHSLYNQSLFLIKEHPSVSYLDQSINVCNIPRKGSYNFLKSHGSYQFGQEDWPRFLKCNNYINKYLNLNNENIISIPVNRTNWSYQIIKYQLKCNNPGDIIVCQHPGIHISDNKCKVLVVEHVQSHNIINVNKFIVPYFSLSLEGLYEKIYTVSLISGCDRLNTVGLVIRNNLLTKINWGDTKVFFKCSCLVCPGKLEYLDLLEIYQKSTFCLVPIGDTMSSRRLYDVVINKCIPILIGPPYHVLPIIKDWSFAVIIEIDEITEQFNLQYRNLTSKFNMMNNIYKLAPEYRISKYNDLPKLIDVLKLDNQKINERYNKLLNVYEQLIY